MADDDAQSAESARPARRSANGHGGRPGSAGVRAAPPRLASGPAGLRGRVRLALIRDLAMGEWSHAEIARAAGATAREIATFAEEHTQEIAEVSAALAGQLALETSGLWVSKKQNRVAELQASHEDVEAVLAYLRSLGVEDGSGLGSRRHFNTLRSQIAILGAIAAEYEPRRGTPTAGGTEGKVLHIIIEGEETESLT